MKKYTSSCEYNEQTKVRDQVAWVRTSHEWANKSVIPEQVFIPNKSSLSEQLQIIRDYPSVVSDSLRYSEQR